MITVIIGIMKNNKTRVDAEGFVGNMSCLLFLMRFEIWGKHDNSNQINISL